MNSPFYKSGGFPEIKKENKGKFTAWAKKNMPGSSDMLVQLLVKRNVS